MNNPCQNHENHGILRILCQNQPHHENLIIPYENHENYGVHKILVQNYENHENLIFILQNKQNLKNKQNIEFHARITQIIKIELLNSRKPKIMEFLEFH